MGKDKTDPFVSGALGAARIFKTRVIDNDLNPVWDETFSVASASFDICCPRAVKHVYQGWEWLDQTAVKSVRAPDQTARFKAL